VGGNALRRRHLLSHNLSCVVVLNATRKRARGIRPFEGVLNYVDKALGVPGQVTVGDLVQEEENVYEVAYEAEAAGWTIVVAVRCECADFRVPHNGHLSLAKVRTTRKQPVERLGHHGVSVIVKFGREGAVREKVWEDEEVGLEDCRSRR